MENRTITPPSAEAIICNQMGAPSPLVLFSRVAAAEWRARRPGSHVEDLFTRTSHEMPVAGRYGNGCLITTKRQLIALGCVAPVFAEMHISEARGGGQYLTRLSLSTDYQQYILSFQENNPNS